MSIVQRVGKTRAKTKAEFVRRYPNESPKEIVAAGKAAGFKIASTYVYNVRAYDKNHPKREDKAAVTCKTPRERKPVTVSGDSTKFTVKAKNSEPITVSSDSRKFSVNVLAAGANGHVASSFEGVLRAAASEIGLSYAIEILQAERVRGQAAMMGVQG